jgi:NAD(P)-dependent dehydrogenase (short-subunit alcohol dehydrogenase family)
VSAGALDGRRGVVTGAAQGIGLAIAESLAGAGAAVVLLDRDPAVEATAGRIGAVGAGTIDVADEGSVRAAFADVLAGGPVDFLVNNAGVRTIAPLLEVTLEDWRRTLAVNLDGTFLCTQAVLPGMLERGGGAIVNIASVAGILAFKNRPAYNASKAGVIAFTKSVALELGARGIRCNAIAPGVVETPLTAEYFEDETFAEGIRRNTAAGQWGQPADIADPVVFLCSDAARFVSGETLVVDGGWCAGKGY